MGRGVPVAGHSMIMGLFSITLVLLGRLGGSVGIATNVN